MGECSIHIHNQMRGLQCVSVGKGGRLELGQRPQIINMPKLTCDREFGARYSILDYCLDKLYASGIKDDPKAVINCYDVAKNIKDYKLPRKVANIICNAYASCDAQKLCPKVLK